MSISITRCTICVVSLLYYVCFFLRSGKDDERVRKRRIIVSPVKVPSYIRPNTGGDADRGPGRDATFKMNLDIRISWLAIITDFELCMYH